MKNLVWLDGRILPRHRALIPIDDRGLLFGDAAFEALRVYDGMLFAWPAHRRRLLRTLRLLHFPRLSLDLDTALKDLISAAAIRDAKLRLTITRGSGENLVARPDAVPRVLLVPQPIPPELASLRQSGVKAILLPFGHGERGLVAGLKTTDYLTAVQGRTLAQRANAFEGIYVEADGSISEGTTSNVFACRGKRVLTPPLAAGCLPGVTRALVLQEAKRAGLAVEERPLRAATLASCDEIFLTGTVIEILPVTRLGREKVGNGRPGKVTQQLAARYTRRRLAETARDRRQG